MIRLKKNKLFLKGYKNLIPGTKIFDRFDPFVIGQTPYFLKKERDLIHGMLIIINI